MNSHEVQAVLLGRYVESLRSEAENERRAREAVRAAGNARNVLAALRALLRGVRVPAEAREAQV
ncbi:hypothetical protein [Deinococcus pimensis]|uniref:hypothetical protein n=1 Tax=Deinococcus pimensis TaxID=309888 RepID=UPI000485FBA6|nr:hypothetical protein [Deinococcus pimensis]